MTTRYDAIMARKYTDRDGAEKSQFTRIGVAFPMKDRDGFSLTLDAFPAPDKETGQYRILLMPPKPREDNAPPRGSSDDYANKRVPQRDDLDDEIPF